jgi:hypothetical protein
MIRREYLHVRIGFVEHQRFDPGAELLLGQVGAETRLAKIPE